MKWDVFISHASEDKDSVARPLASLLTRSGLAVWLDAHELRLGDSLSAKLNEGIAESRFGVVILSRAFFAKDWPTRELAALTALESRQRKVTLPVWHGIDAEVVAKYMPLMADKLAVDTGGGLGTVATYILDIVVPLRAHELRVPLDHYFPEDRKLFEDLAQLFNRPAFRGPFLWQTDPEPHQRAMRQTLKALNTGIVEDSAGKIQNTIEPITRIRDSKLHARMQHVETQLKATSNLVEVLHTATESSRHIEILSEIDKKRDAIIANLNEIWSCFGLHPLPIPTEITDSTDVWERFLNPEPQSHD